MSDRRAEWLLIAEQVLAGTFDREPESIRESIQIGLGGFTDAKAIEAMKYLDTLSTRGRKKK